MTNPESQKQPNISTDNDVECHIEMINAGYHFGFQEMSDTETLETWKFANEWLSELNALHEKGRRTDVYGGGIKLQGEE